jgi:hypothetical protein
MNGVVASLCVWWSVYCGNVDLPNTWPLAFGMTAAEAEAALGAPLIYHSGPRGSEIYLAKYPARIPGAYPVKEGIALQFRGGRLTGWKKDWKLRRPWHHW